MMRHDPAPVSDAAVAQAFAAPFDQPLKAIPVLCLGIALFSTQDVAIKWLSGGFPVHQIVFVRSFVGLLPTLKRSEKP